MSKPINETFIKAILAMALSIAPHAMLTAGEADISAISEEPSNPGWSPATYRVARERARMRNRPDLESTVIAELHRDDLVYAEGQAGDFYSIRPPVGTKAFVFCSYVENGIVRADNVNVRLAPTLDAPIIGRLHKGDSIKSSGSSADQQWLEIECPDSIRFYVSQALLEEVGSADIYADLAPRQAEAKHMLEKAEAIVAQQVHNSYDQMRLEEPTKLLSYVIDNFTDLKLMSGRAKTLLNQLNEDYAAKKVAYLEGSETPIKSLSPEIAKSLELLHEHTSINITDKMRRWEPMERSLIQGWLALNPGQTPHDFYLEEQRVAKEIIGVLEPSSSSARNCPGDYILRANAVPVAFLYSTVVNLQEAVGHQVRLTVSPRPNNNFAFESYFVHQMDVESCDE